MELNLKGRNILVTGASKGLGRATALAFAKEGAKVFAISRSEKELKELGIQGFFIGDLTEEGKVAEAINALEPKEGFNIVVHCIGNSLGLAREPLSSWQEWEKTLRLNVGIAMDINT